jgi:hypothetical protein
MARPIPGYGLKPPHEGEVVESLSRMLGRERGQETWRTVCRELGIRHPGPPLSLEQLAEVARELSRRPGLVSVIGRTLAIRLNSYRALKRATDEEMGEVTAP